MRADRTAEYQNLTVPILEPNKRVLAAEIRKVDPAKHAGKEEFIVVGYVQDYLEQHATSILRKVGTLGQQVLLRSLGRKRSQLTIITSDSKSYTVFADLSSFVVQRKDMVLARVKAVKVVGLKGITGIFIANEVLLVRGVQGNGLNSALTA